MSSRSTSYKEPDSTPLGSAKDARLSYHFLAGAQGAMPFDSTGNPWTGANVFNSGNLVEDLLHNFFLECGARTHKMKVYEMTDHPAARAVVGFLLVRGGVHVVAYAKAIEVATGVNVTKLVPIPSLNNKSFSEAKNMKKKACIPSYTPGVKVTSAPSIRFGREPTQRIIFRLKLFKDPLKAFRSPLLRQSKRNSLPESPRRL